MDRYNFYYRQKVMEDELDNAFDEVENADRALSIDLDFLARTPPAQKENYGGVMWGFGVTNPSGLDIAIASGAAYDELGQRVYTSQAYTVTVSNEGDVESAGSTVIGAGGTPAGAATDPGNGNSVWVSVYIAFARKDTQERFDGYNASVWFQNAESFYFHVAKGAVKATGSLEITDKPARLENKVLLADIKIKNDGSVAVDGDPDVSRTEWYLNISTTTGLQKAVSQKGNVRDAVTTLLDYYNEHASGLADKHKGNQIEFATGSLGTTWYGGEAGTYGGSITVTEALTNLSIDLKDTSADCGTKRIGSVGVGGSYGNTTSVANLTVGSLKDQLEELLVAVNSRVFRGGDSGITGALVPGTDGIALGVNGGNGWDVFARDLKLSRWVYSSLTPDTTATYNLGSATKTWNEIHCAILQVAGLYVGGTSSFGGDSTFSGGTNVMSGALIVNGTMAMTGQIQLTGGIATAATPALNNSYNIGGDPTAAGKAWQEVHAYTLKAYQSIEVIEGSFSLTPAVTNPFTIWTTTGATDPAFKFDPTNLATDDPSIEIGTPTVVDTTGITPATGVHTLRIVPTELGLATTTPKMPLAFGPNAAATGGMNQYGIPVHNWHFRDDFMYHPDKFDEALIDGTTGTHDQYKMFGAATSTVSINPEKGLQITSDSAGDAVITAGIRMKGSYQDWAIHGKVELQDTTNVEVTVGWYSTSTIEVTMRYFAGGSTDTWSYYGFNGTSSDTGDMTGLTPAGGPLYFTIRQIGGDAIQVLGRTTQGAFQRTLTVSFAPSWDWGAKIEINDPTTGGKTVYLHYWEWYRQAPPIY